MTVCACAVAIKMNCGEWDCGYIIIQVSYSSITIIVLKFELESDLDQEVNLQIIPKLSINGHELDSE